MSWKSVLVEPGGAGGRERRGVEGRPFLLSKAGEMTYGWLLRREIYGGGGSSGDLADFDFDFDRDSDRGPDPSRPRLVDREGSSSDSE